MPVSKKTKFIIATVVLVIIISLLIAEVAIRIYQRTCDRERFIWIPDPFLGYVHTPNNKFTYHYTEGERISVLHKTNSLGFIGKETSVRKPDETLRIIVLGDSYTEALQYTADSNFCGRLETLLSGYPEKSYKRTEVLNAGVSGYSPITYYLYFKRELAKLKPDIVAAQLFANDVFEDNEVRAKSLLDEGGLPVKIDRYFREDYYNNKFVKSGEFNPNPFMYRLTKFLINKSRFFEYMYVKIINVRKQSDFHQTMIRKKQFATGHQFFMIDPRIMLFSDAEFKSRTWGQTQKYILALKELVEDAGAKFVLFYIPMETQIKLDKYGTHTRLYIGAYVGSHFNTLLDEFARKNNVNFLDTLPALEKNKQKGLYLDRDGHLTYAGHEVVSRALFDYLMRNNLLP